MKTDASIGPFFNWFNPKCSDVWASNSYFKAMVNRKAIQESKYFKKDPICYWVYGAKGSIVLSQIQGSYIRFLDSVKAFQNANEKVTTVSFARDQQSPKVFIGSDQGSALVYDIEKNFFIHESVEHLSEEKSMHSRKITCSEWTDSENVFYAVDTFVVHWNCKSGVIEHVVIGAKSMKPGRLITTLVVSKFEPIYLAIGYEGGEVVVLHMGNKTCRDGRILHQFCGNHADICSLAFPFEKGGFERGILAAMTRDGTLSVYEMHHGKRIVDFTNECKKVSNSKDRNYFALAFVPPPYSGHSHNQYTIRKHVEYDDADEMDNKNFHLLFTNSTGEMQCMYLPKFPSASGVKRPKVVEFDRQKNHFHSNVVFNIAISAPSPQLAVSISLDRQAILWDLREKKAKSVYPTFSHQIHDLSFNQFDPHTLAIASGEGLKLWKVANCTDEKNESDPYRVITIRKNLPTNAKLMTVAWNPTKEKQLATGTDDGQIFVLDVSQSKPSMKYFYNGRDRQKTQVYTLVWGPLPSNSSAESEPLMALYCILSGGKFKIHVPTTSKVYDFVEISDSCKAYGRTEVAWRTDFKFLAVGNEDGTIELYENNRKDSLLKFVVVVQSIHTKLILCLRWHPFLVANGESTPGLEFWLASGSHDTKVQIIDFKSVIDEIHGAEDPALPAVIVEPTRTLLAHTARVNSLAWSPLKEGLLASCSYDNTVQIWDAIHGVPLYNFRGHASRLFTVCWSAVDPDLVFSGGDDNTLHVWKPSIQDDKMPPLHEANGDFVTRKQAKSEAESTSFTVWPSHKESDDDQFRITSISTEEVDEGSQLKRPIPLNQGGDECEFRPTRAPEEVVITATVPEVQRQVKTSFVKKSTSADKDKKKSLFPLTNVAENSSTRHQHFQDIEYLLTLRKDRHSWKRSPDEVAFEVINRTLFYGNVSSVKDLVQLESNNHRQSGNMQSAYILDLLQGDIKHTVKDAIKRGELNDTLVAMAATVSRSFWFDTIENYVNQLKNTGDYVMAALYLIAIYKFKEAVNLLVDKKLFKEALIIAKSRFPVESEVVVHIMREWAKEKEAIGNYEAAVKCLVAIGNYCDAAFLLAKRSSDYWSLYYASRLAKEGGFNQQFQSYFGQALKEGFLKELPEEEFNKLLKLWTSPEEKQTFESFLKYYRDFNAKMNDQVNPLDYLLVKLPWHKSGIDYLSKFCGIGIQNFIVGNKEVIFRMTFHLFKLNSTLVEYNPSEKVMNGCKEDKDSHDSPLFHTLTAIDTLCSYYSVNEENYSLCAKLLQYISLVSFPMYKSSDIIVISKNIESHMCEKFGLECEFDEELLKKLTQICVSSYLLTILDAVSVGKEPFKRMLICAHKENTIDGTDDDEVVITCDNIRSLKQGLHAEKGLFAKIKADIDVAVLHKICSISQ
ncbi:gem-associated protein 5-like protein [Leptotrombidium deliense]|uniref:Gem-associated protein 5-like protein n=1 Tax=Leptotrombidium deliense TaxID=299467 RepID=A0A443STT2_9ACAR|nr:gem-associated protein 5-like protein [Leptotrombidium deliense]